MNAVEALRVALAAIMANRLRSALTTFGIVIGVASVILLVAFGNGASRFVSKQVQGLGTNTVYVIPASVKVQGVQLGGGTAQTLTMQDLKSLSDKSRAPDVATVTPTASSSETLQYQSQNWRTTVTGSTDTYADATGYSMATGTFFTATDVRNSAKVVVVGQTVVDNLFGGDSEGAVGRMIEIQRQPFRVVGTFAGAGYGEDDVAVIPITAAWNYLLGAGGGKNITEIVLEATSSDAVPAAQSEATEILLADHRISDPAQADFQVQSSQNLQKTLGSITGALTAMLGGIAGISLVVAGIGIMNIMLVTVTERTREIGIRKAIGARRSAILLQFLIESMTLAGGGGLFGVLLGLSLSSLADDALSGGSIPAPVVSAPVVLVALGVSVGIGLFFGIYPANRAAGLSPIEALRYE